MTILKVLPVPGPPVSIINTRLFAAISTACRCCRQLHSASSSKSTYPVTDSGHFYLNWTTQKLIQSLCQFLFALEKRRLVANILVFTMSLQHYLFFHTHLKHQLLPLAGLADGLANSIFVLRALLILRMVEAVPSSAASPST